MYGSLIEYLQLNELSLMKIVDEYDPLSVEWKLMNHDMKYYKKVYSVKVLLIPTEREKKRIH
jgi:hypothetical protein